MNGATAPSFTTAFVWSEVPEATLVRAQDASNWISGLKKGIQHVALIVNYKYDIKYQVNNRNKRDASNSMVLGRRPDECNCLT